MQRDMVLRAAATAVMHCDPTGWCQRNLGYKIKCVTQVVAVQAWKHIKGGTKLSGMLVNNDKFPVNTVHCCRVATI